MRLRMPLPKEGKKADWKQHHEQSRRTVMLRCRARCEGCNKTTRYLEWAHIFGRRQIIGEPWCSSPELTAALCVYDPITQAVGCHKQIDLRLNPALRRRLEETAARRFYAAHKTRYPTTLDPDGAVRRLVKKLEKLGGG